MENELKARFQHAVIGEDNTSTSSIPKKGELIFNSTLDNFRIGVDGNTPYSSLTDFLHNFTGADASSNGTAGLVPAPSAGDQTKFLRGDGTWQDAGGGGGSYTLPVATSSALGGIKIGYTQNSNNYPVQLGSNTGDTGTDSRAYVNVPWYNTTYQFYLNGTRTDGSDSTGVNLSSPDGIIKGIYAPVDAGSATNKYLYWNNATGHLKPEWGTLSDLGIYSRDFKHALNGASSGNVVGTVLRTTNSDFTFPTFYAPTISGTSGQLLISKGSSNAPDWIDVGEGLALNTSSTPNKLDLQQAEVYSASASELGGVKVASVQPHPITIQTSDAPDTSNTHRYALHLCTNNDAKQLAYVYVPWTDTKYDPASINNGINPGLLQIAADAEPAETYINDKHITAIPVFYTGDSVENNKTFVYEDATGIFDKDGYKESENNFVGHYVNLYDVISGLIKNPGLLAILRDALDGTKY